VKIGFVGGTGEEGMGLAYRFARAGHHCLIGSRRDENAQASVAELKEKDASLPLTGGLNDVAATCDIVVVTTPFAAQAATLPPLAGLVAGKIVVNAVVPMAFEAGRASLIDVAEGSAAQEAQALLPDATVVAAFQNLSARKLLKGGAVEADVVVCSDDASARKQIMALAGDIEGVRGVDGGALANAKVVEAITVLLVSINRAYKTQAGIRIAGV
jgi:NADPH-dependent F420 reductase